MVSVVLATTGRRSKGEHDHDALPNRIWSRCGSVFGQYAHSESLSFGLWTPLSVAHCFARIVVFFASTRDRVLQNTASCVLEPSLNMAGALCLVRLVQSPLPLCLA